jgi:hypothetical protein
VEPIPEEDRVTVPITGSVKDVTGVEDNDTPWSFASVIRFADDGSVITEKPREVRAVSGNLKVNLVPGYAIVTYGKHVWQVTVPETATTLKALIEAGVAYPPETSQEALDAAVVNALPPLVADELEAQTADAVAADLTAREMTVTDAGGGAAQFALGGVDLGDPFPLPAATWSGIAGEDPEVNSAFRPSINLITSAVNVEREAVGVDWADGAEVRTHLQGVFDTYAGERDILVPNREYLLGVDGVTGANRITIPSGARINFQTDAVLVVNQVDSQSMPSILFAGGSDGVKANLTANSAEGAQTVVLPTGQGVNFAVGDLIGFESTLAVTISNGVNVGYAREIRRVEYVTGDTVALDIPLDFAYATADGAQFWKITPAHDITLEGLKFISGDGVTPGTDGSYALRLDRTRNVHVGDFSAENMIGGILLQDAYDTVIDDPKIHSLPYFGTAYAYGITARASTTRLVINNYRASRCRHTFSTLADERTGTPNTFWGGPMFVQANNWICSSSADSQYAVIDTHEFGRHIHFNNPMVFGGANNQGNGIQIRAQHVQLTNPRTFRCGKYGLLLFDSSRNCKVLGGEFAYNGADGILVFGDNHQLVAPRSHHNGGAGISYIGTNDLVIINPDLYDNTLRGLSDSTVTPSVRTQIIGGRIPQSASQTQSVGNASSTTVMQNLLCSGFGAAATGLNNAHASALYDIQTDTTRISNMPFGSPRVSTALNDVNGNELVKFTSAASAVNEFTVANAAAGGIPSLALSGNDTDISGQFATKGTGRWYWYQQSGVNIRHTAQGAAADVGWYFDTKGAGAFLINNFAVPTRRAAVPSSATDTGIAGQVAWDASYFYVCTATNTWRRAAVTSW